MSKDNKKILEYRKVIAEQKKKIKLEKRLMRKKKRLAYKKSSFGKTAIGKFFGKVFFVFSEKSSYSFTELFVTTLISLILGFFACFSVFSVLGGGRNYFKLSKELGKFYDVYEVLTERYNGDIDKNDLVEEAINGMVSSVGDVYTSYNNQDDAESFNQLVSGTYEGIGCTIQTLDIGVRVVEVYDNSPAFKAGLKADDIIIKVDDMDAKELGTTKLSEYIRNDAKGKIKMIVMRGDKELTFTLERDKVEIPSIVVKTFDKNGKKVGYLGITIFSSVSAKQFEKQLLKLEEDEIVGLVIDVRGNSGGYLTAVTDIASLLLPKGKTIYQIQNDKKNEITKDKTADKREYPIAILTNKSSASASEILAAAIKESYNGYVVGEKTYGKGTVQQVKKLSDGSMVKYTVENWLTPNGEWINGKGVEPTDGISLEEEYLKNPTNENDNQLQKALELVSK